jgi:hypothetical protein
MFFNRAKQNEFLFTNIFIFNKLSIHIEAYEKFFNNSVLALSKILNASLEPG